MVTRGGKKKKKKRCTDIGLTKNVEVTNLVSILSIPIQNIKKNCQILKILKTFIKTKDNIQEKIGYQKRVSSERE
jgi:hypothetical protein